MEQFRKFLRDKAFALVLTACLLGVGCWATLGRALSQWLATPARQQGLNRILALMLVISVFSMLA